MKKILLWDPRFPESSPLRAIVSNAVAAAIAADGTGAILPDFVTGLALIGGDAGVSLAPVNTVLPAITGIAQDGQTLAVSNGTWSNSPTSFIYQWRRNGAIISGAVNAGRTLTSADVGAVITCTVTATNEFGSIGATSAATATVVAATVALPANTAAPVVSGTGTIGQTLSTTNGTWSNSPTGYAYQWRRDGVDITGATASTYVLVTADGGTGVTCRVTATNAGGSAGATSNAIAVAAPAAVLSSIDAAGWTSQYNGTPPTFAPDTAPQTVSVSRAGYDATAAAVTRTETLVLTQRVRQPWPNDGSLTAATVALSDYVYSTDTISGVGNNSAEVSPKPIVQWVTPARAVVGNTIGGATNPIELVAFHRNARGGRQVAAVKFLVSDGTTTLNATVAATIVSARTGDRNAVLVYRMPAIDITGLNAGLLTVNAEVYPWVGGAASIAKSADSSVAREFSPRLFLKNVGLAANPPYAYVAKAADSSAQQPIGTPSSSGTVSTTLATAKATPFDTVQNALTAIHAAYGSTTGVDGCIIMLGDDGGTPHILASSTVARTQKVAALTIAFDPLRARTACRASFGAAAFRPQLGSLLSGVSEAAIRFDCDIVRTGTATLQGEAAAPLQLIFDNSLTFDNASNSATFLANSHAYHLGTTFLNVSGSATIGPAANEHRLFRGISLQPASVAAGVTLEGWSVIGSAIRNPQFQFGARLAGGGVVAFNTLTDPPTSSIMLQLGQAAGSAPSADVNGFAFVQNMVEYISATGNAVLRISGDSATGNNSHVVVHHNSHAGAHLCGRWNAFYDEGATPRTSKLMSVVGNLGVAFFTKSDVFHGVNENNPEGFTNANPSNRMGSWAFLYGVGCQGNFTQFQSADPIGGTQAQAYPGLGSKLGTSKRDRQDPLFVSYQGTTTDPAGSTTTPTYVAGAGGSNLVLQSTSPAKGLVTSAVLSHGLTGVARPTTGDAAGAYVPLA